MATAAATDKTPTETPEKSTTSAPVEKPAKAAEKPETAPKDEKKVEAVRTNMLLIAPEDILVIGLDTTDGPEHPLYDERVKLPLDKNMVANVKHFGVKEPVLLTKTDAKYPGKYVTCAGRQRIRWARAANVQLKAEGQAPLQVRSILEKGDESELAGVMILENEVRQGDDMLTKARKASRLINKHGYSEKQAAVAFGVATSSLRIWLKLLELSPAAQKAVDEGKLTASAALQLKELPADQQKQALEGLIAAAEEAAKGNGAEDEKPDADEEDGTKAPKKKGKKGKFKITAKDVAAVTAKAGGAAAPKAGEVAQTSVAPKRASIRRALKFAQDQKGTYARIAGVILAWVIGDVDIKKAEMEELGEDQREGVRNILKASVKRTKIKIK